MPIIPKSQSNRRHMDIKISISGCDGSGKTTIAEAIRNLLETWDMEVTLVDDSENPHPLCDRLDALSEKGVKVEIRTVQTKRNKSGKIKA